MVIGPPLLICSLNKGMTLPRLPSTFPKRTAQNFVFPVLFKFVMINSATRFVAHIILGGFTALSVEIITKLATFAAFAASAVFFVPNILFLIADCGLYSIKGTCL